MIEPPSLICIIGPPASGKTSLAESLSSALDAPIIRPRGAIHRTITRYPEVIGLFPKDGQGYVPDAALGFALRADVDLLSDDKHAVLENLPWDVFQLADLYRIGRPLVIAYLHATDELVIDRRLNRKDCDHCYPNALMTEDGSHCARCCHELTVRRDDHRETFLDRLMKSRRNTIGILSLAHRFGLRVCTLDASLPESAIATQALEVISGAYLASQAQ